MKDQIRQQIQSAIEKLYPEHKDIVFSVDYAPAGIDADFASNAAMVLAKKLGKKPMEVAAALAAAILDAGGRRPIADRISDPLQDKDSIAPTKSVLQNDTVNVAPPGFLNFKLPDEIWLAELLQMIAAGEKYGRPESRKKEKVLMEYFQPNIAKPLHVGHMRSAIIGDCLYRVEKLFSEKVESDTHMGDWGTQFGLILHAYKLWGEDAVIEQDPVNELNRLYVRINKEMEDRPELLAAGKAEFVKLEQGDKENRKLWQKFVDWSMERFLRINDLLDILPFDHHWPESFYEDKMAAVLQQLAKAGLLKKSQGAQVVNLEKYGLGMALVVKSDEGTTYLLRDLATYLYRKHEQGFFGQYYVVDNRQSHHFRQMFKILELLKEWHVGEGEHVEFGFMSLPEGAMSTRKGNVVELEEVVAKAVEKARDIIAEKNPDLKEADSIARDVAIGALKYFDLSHNRKSDIVFTWDKALTFEGNTGPYIMYTHARLRSILRKSGEIGAKQTKFRFVHAEELSLLRKLARYGSVLTAVAESKMPNKLTDYLFDLASLLNNYYQKVQVLQEKDKALRASRLGLLQAAAQIMKNGLQLLGIKAPEEM